MVPASKMHSRVVFAGALCMVSACVSVDALSPDHKPATPQPVEVTQQFCYRPAPIVDELTLSEEKSLYRVYDVSLQAGLADR